MGEVRSPSDFGDITMARVTFDPDISKQEREFMMKIKYISDKYEAEKIRQIHSPDRGGAIFS
jgi:hypothetical protein